MSVTVYDLEPGEAVCPTCEGKRNCADHYCRVVLSSERELCAQDCGAGCQCGECNGTDKCARCAGTGILPVDRLSEKEVQQHNSWSYL